MQRTRRNTADDERFLLGRGVRPMRAQAEDHRDVPVGNPRPVQLVQQRGRGGQTGRAVMSAVTRTTRWPGETSARDAGDRWFGQAARTRSASASAPRSPGRQDGAAYPAGRRSRWRVAVFRESSTAAPRPAPIVGRRRRNEKRPPAGPREGARQRIRCREAERSAFRAGGRRRCRRGARALAAPAPAPAALLAASLSLLLRRGLARPLGRLGRLRPRNSMPPTGPVPMR